MLVSENQTSAVIELMFRAGTAAIESVWIHNYTMATQAEVIFLGPRSARGKRFGLMLSFVRRKNKLRKQGTFLHQRQEGV